MIGTAGMIGVFGGPFSTSWICTSACVAFSAIAFVRTAIFTRRTIAHPNANRFLSQCFGGRLATRDQSRFALRVPAARSRGLQSALEAPPEIVIGRPLVDARVPVRSVGGGSRTRGSSWCLPSFLVALLAIVPSTVEASPLRSVGMTLFSVAPYLAVAGVVIGACLLVGRAEYRRGFAVGRSAGYRTAWDEACGANQDVAADNRKLHADLRAAREDLQRSHLEQVRRADAERANVYRAKAEQIRRGV